MRIAIVAGEMSGDMLGAALMDSLKKIYPDAVFEGVGGAHMLDRGFNSLYPMETLSVMGLIEPLKRLPQLLGIKNGLLRHFTETPPDVFIGIDSPDFNHRLEIPLKRTNIPCVHYVSPSVWAWRQGRVKGIRKAVDLMLCLLPFEAEFYDKEKVSAKFVGHPMADEIPLSKEIEIDEELDSICGSTNEVFCLMPGSRAAELSKIAPVFFDVAEKLHAENPDSVFLVPAVHEKAHRTLVDIKNDREYIHIINAKARAVLARSKAALVASGTATLEAMLMKCPMVVAYKADALSWFIGSRMVKTDHISLVNLIAGKALVKERLQDDCNTEVLLKDLGELLEKENAHSMVSEFARLHAELRHGASETAARAIADLVEQSKC